MGRVQGRRTTGGQGTGKTNWRAKTENKKRRRTTGGHCPGKADNWRADEGGHLVGKVEGRQTTGGQIPRKTDN